MARKRRRTALQERLTLDELLKFVEFINRFRGIRRFIFYQGGGDERECNGDHCYQLAMSALFVASVERPELNLLRVIIYALIHDLVEVYAGDTPIVRPEDEGKYGPTRATKEAREREALKRIACEWSELFPLLVSYLEAYERQEDKEAVFVHSLDKLLPQINIRLDGCGERTNGLVGISIAEAAARKRAGIRDLEILRLFDELYARWEQPLCG